MAKRLQLVVTIFLFLNLNSQAQFTSVSFSIQAHQDDWQLFMSSKVIADLSVSGRKVVFITLTAGDGSAGAGSYSPSGVPFYLSRENGAVYSCKYSADLTTGTAPLAVPTATTASITGNSAHNITKYVYKNTVNYFLRLPDGNGDGSGFNNTGFVSLQKLRAGSITSISALGPVAATYTGWSDLTNTIRAIINAERVTGTQSWIHTASTDNTYNLNDHSDHLNSSYAAQAAVNTGMTWVGINEFRDYNSSSFPGNLSATEHENAAAIFAVTNWGIVEARYATSFNSGHLGWLPMDYFRVLKTPTTNAPFAGTGDGPTESTLVSDHSGAGTSTTMITEIPMIVSITSPAFINKDISMIISPYEKGQLVSIIYDSEEKKVKEIITHVENREPILITLKQAVSVKGSYTIKNILNDKFIETRKIVVE